jgi:hypothetical protein
MLKLTTLLTLRGTLIAVIRALDALLLEAHGWTPRRRAASLDDIVYTESQMNGP